MISLFPGISYLSVSVVNWFVNARCCGMMRNADGRDWKRCLGWILADRERGVWIWFSCYFLIFARWVLVCIACANNKLNFEISKNRFIAEVHNFQYLCIAFANLKPLHSQTNQKIKGGDCFLKPKTENLVNIYFNIFLI